MSTRSGRRYRDPFDIGPARGARRVVITPGSEAYRPPIQHHSPGSEGYQIPSNLQKYADLDWNKDIYIYPRQIGARHMVFTYIVTRPITKAQAFHIFYLCGVGKFYSVIGKRTKGGRHGPLPKKMVYHILGDRVDWSRSDLDMIPIESFDDKFELPVQSITAAERQEVNAYAFDRFRRSYLNDHGNFCSCPLIFKAHWHLAECRRQFVDVNPLPYIYEFLVNVWAQIDHERKGEKK